MSQSGRKTEGGLGASWNRWRRRRQAEEMALRGDMLLDPPPEIRLLLEMSGEMIPDAARELAKDLFGLLLFLDQAGRAGRPKGGSIDAYRVLQAVRKRALQGYWEPAGLAREARGALPKSDVAERFALYCEELAAKRSSFLFLPILACIDRHQAQGPLGDAEVSVLLTAGVESEPGGDHAGLTDLAFALWPEAKERRAFQFAAMLAPPRSPVMAAAERLEQIRDALRGLAQGEVPKRALSPQSETAIRKIAAEAPWIWMEALVVVDSWRAGPQFFDHAFEVEMHTATF